MRLEEAPVTRQTRYGPLATFDNADMISHFLARCGEWAWDEACFVASTLPEGARVLDAGAFLGTFGLGVALRKHLGCLCCVEANPAVLPLLGANVRRNANCPALVVGAMLASSNFPSRPGRGDPLNLGSTSFMESAAGEELVQQHGRSITLAELRAEHGDFDLIKLDVEGMEHEILRDDEDYLKRGGAALWVECNDDPRSLELAELLLSWGLELHYFAFPSHNPDNFLGEAEPILPWAYEAGLLAAPKTTPCLDPEFVAHRCILRPIASVGDLKEAMWLTPRWLPAVLAHADVVELAAIASRGLRRQERGTFLTAQADAESSRLRETQAGLARAEALAFERLGQLNLERERREATEAGLAHAEALAFEHLGQLELERERREAAEQHLARATAVALDRLSEIGLTREHLQAAELGLVQAREEYAASVGTLESEHAALLAQAKSEHAAERTSLLSMMSLLRQQRAHLAQQLKRTYQRPWRPIKEIVGFYSLTVFAALSAPISERNWARFARSAQKRSPSRFDKFLGDTTEALELPARPSTIER